MHARMYGFPYLSANSFLGAPHDDASRRYAVAGVPFDGAVTNRPGARFAPEAIRRASQMLCDGVHPLFDVSPTNFLTDLGDLMLPNTGIEAARQELQRLAFAALGRHYVCWLGGDHSVTLSLLRAQRERHGRPLALVHFDAHCDTWTDHFGEASGHGTWTYEAIQEGLVIPAATMQIGIRSSGLREAREYVNSVGGRVFTARELRGLESPEQLTTMLDEIRRRIAAAGNPPTYLTLDIDCLDPAFAPGTGTPEPGGLNTSQVLSVLEALYDLPWAGMDCVEVSPPYDHAELTSHAAAVFVWTHLCGLLAARRE
ncbi:MAG: agmatinase [Betaproteobacteria bacterium]|nr:agmatinase [Betaproteobacteria bacterium]